MADNFQNDIFKSFDTADAPKIKEKKAAAPRLFDIHQAIAAVDMNRGDWYSEQSDEVKKQFAPPVFLRWAATIDNNKPDETAYMLCAINDTVNHHMWDLWEHPELVFRLAATCGLGVRRRAAWIKGPEKKSKSSKLHGFISKWYPDANETEIELILKKYDKDSFSYFMYHESGCGETESKEMIKLFKKYLSELD